MPIRWVICPMTTVNDVRLPLVGTLVDSGKPLNGDGSSPTYSYSAVCGLANWSLCYVPFISAAGMDANGQVIHLFEQDYTDPSFLDLTPADLGWNNARLNRIRNRMTAQGVDTTGLTNATPIRDWVNRIGTTLDAGFDGKKLFAVAAGA